ncbi:uncharacterized protein LOC135703650 [Ochlerotatus camptorhynchus]|uniref:uncharacterized protein LOC135703650 n=1 Tax=Ochlerotatus camptorhynchus TaxID=644619 RepID=UPI0031D04543
MYLRAIIVQVLVAAIHVLSKSDPPMGCVLLESVAYRKFLFSGLYHSSMYDRNVNYDNWEHLVDKEWIVEKSGKEYRIYTIKNQIAPMYLHTNKAMQLDGDRRRVHLSAFINGTQEMQWTVEQQKNGYFAIKNKQLKEYLYAGERKYDVPYGCLQPYEMNLNHWKTNNTICRTVGQVFTWKGKVPKELGFEYLWNVRPC